MICKFSSEPVSTIRYWKYAQILSAYLKSAVKVISTLISLIAEEAGIKMEGVQKFPELINEEVGINVEGVIFCKKLGLAKKLNPSFIWSCYFSCHKTAFWI